MDKLKLKIILGSTRQNRLGGKVAWWVKKYAESRKDFESEFIDLKDWPLPFYNEASGPEGLKGHYSVEIAKKWAAKVGEAEAFLIVNPEYNHGYSAVLKNALDYAYAEWNKKPVAFVSYGGSAGGARAVEQLRLVSIELQMVPIRPAVHIVGVWKAFDENGKITESDYEKRLAGVFDELIWWASVLKAARLKN